LLLAATLTPVPCCHRCPARAPLQTAVRSQLNMLHYAAAGHVRFQTKNSTLGIAQQHMERLTEALVRRAHRAVTARLKRATTAGAAGTAAKSGAGKKEQDRGKQSRRVCAADVRSGVAADNALRRVVSRVGGEGCAGSSGGGDHCALAAATSSPASAAGALVPGQDGDAREPGAVGEGVATADGRRQMAGGCSEASTGLVHRHLLQRAEIDINRHFLQGHTVGQIVVDEVVLSSYAHKNVNRK